MTRRLTPRGSPGTTGGLMVATAGDDRVVAVWDLPE
jgi:hypothetical protein